MYCDIKLGNILFDDEMNVKIVDFGFSKVVVEDYEVMLLMCVWGIYGYV